MRLPQQAVRSLRRGITIAALGGTATATASNSAATVTFQLGSPNQPCLLTVTSTKDVSNYVVDGVKTELRDGTTVLVLNVQPGDVVKVKSGTTVAEFDVPAGLSCDGQL